MFQSTHSLRSATPCEPCNAVHVFSFNPRTPCGVRQCATGRPPSCRKFQSTHSLRSATPNTLKDSLKIAVSIHALLAECDPWAVAPALEDLGFNPRTPCGVRLASTRAHAMNTRFNPRTPCGVRRNRLYTLLLNRANHTLRQPP